jgi:hypothetical protein
MSSSPEANTNTTTNTTTTTTTTNTTTTNTTTTTSSSSTEAEAAVEETEESIHEEFVPTPSQRVHLFIYNLYNIIRNIDLLRQYTSIKYGSSSVGACYSSPQALTHESLSSNRINENNMFEEEGNKMDHQHMGTSPSETNKNMRALPYL